MAGCPNGLEQSTTVCRASRRPDGHKPGDSLAVDEVIAAANNTQYGLAAYVITNDLTVAWRMAEGLEAGIIGINDPVPTTVQCPFGGMKESGVGRELAREGLESYLETKFISMKLRD